MELIRKLAPMNGFFTPSSLQSSSADSWIRWRGLLLYCYCTIIFYFIDVAFPGIYELFVQAKSHQQITSVLIASEVDKVKFPVHLEVKACLLILSLNQDVVLDPNEGFCEIKDGKLSLVYTLCCLVLFFR